MSPHRTTHFIQDFYISLIKQGYNVTTNIIINAHESWEDEARSHWIMEIVMSQISRLQNDALDNSIRALEGSSSPKRETWYLTFAS